MIMRVIKTPNGGCDLLNDCPHLYLHAIISPDNKITSYECEVRGPTKTQPTPKPPAKKTGCGGKRIARLAKGAAAFAKLALGVDAADDQTIDSRQAICKVCDGNDRWHCLDCGCILSEKTRLNSEACPRGKWKKVEITENESDEQQ